VQLLSAGIDENPLVYKDIHQVMRSQADLVEVIARFDPRIVRMADAGERAGRLRRVVHAPWPVRVARACTHARGGTTDDPRA
jgi:hypothetical protein